MVVMMMLMNGEIWDQLSTILHLFIMMLIVDQRCLLICDELHGDAEGENHLKSHGAWINYTPEN